MKELFLHRCCRKNQLRWCQIPKGHASCQKNEVGKRDSAIPSQFWIKQFPNSLSDQWWNLWRNWLGFEAPMKGGIRMHGEIKRMLIGNHSCASWLLNHLESYNVWSKKNKNEKHLEPQTIQVRFGPKDPFGAKNINIFWDIHKRNPRFSLVFRHVHWFSKVFHMIGQRSGITEEQEFKLLSRQCMKNCVTI